MVNMVNESKQNGMKTVQDVAQHSCQNFKNIALDCTSTGVTSLILGRETIRLVQGVCS